MNNLELQTIKSSISHTFQDKVTRLLCIVEYMKRNNISTSEMEYICGVQSRTISNLTNCDKVRDYCGINSNSINKMYSNLVQLVNTFNEKSYNPVTCHNVYIKKYKLNNDMISDIKYLLNV